MVVSEHNLFVGFSLPHPKEVFKYYVNTLGEGGEEVQASLNFADKGLSLEQKLSALQQQQLTTQSSPRNVTPVDDIKQDQVEGFVSPIYSSQQLADAQRQLSVLKDRLVAHDEEISLLTQELAVSRQREAELERRVTPEGREPETSPLLKIGKVGHKGGTNTAVMCPQSKVSSFGSDQSLKEEKGISEVVSRLNKEKEELLNALKVVQDREQSNAKSWADEKAALIRSVLAAEADVDNIHSQEMRDGELTVTDKDERVAHLFGKYLRSESYRKALVWQKRYLLVVLGGYQECEALTLDRLAFLSGCSQDNGRTRSPKDKFRSAVLVVVVIQRMKYLVRRWKHGRRLGGNAVLNRLHTESVASSTRSSYNAPRRRWGSYSQSPPCKDVTFRGAHWHSTSTSQPWRHSETVGFRPSQLSEYIDRFDQIQQRLGLTVANRPT
uniref:(California timema) hypothetical protein n=1 Tax=Timema californicum TaxID=61474 RepID=A0A7R9P348_TIMCA|nr:unnamed protein product [Timema californicum]